MSEHDEISIAHMSMIQGIVTRLETNCFTLKAMAMALAAALLAFVGSLKNPNWVYPLAGCLPVIVFWIMDAQYLRLGRAYRKLYDAVRKHEVADPFSMDIRLYLKEVKKLLRTAISWSVLWYYVSILAVFLFITLRFFFAAKEATNA